MKGGKLAVEENIQTCNNLFNSRVTLQSVEAMWQHVERQLNDNKRLSISEEGAVAGKKAVSWQCRHGKTNVNVHV
jgi:hypothetical protein